jgi:predicted nuclease with TOPRIM domain
MMNNDSRIIELLAEMVHKQDVIITELQGLKSEQRTSNERLERLEHEHRQTNERLLRTEKHLAKNSSEISRLANAVSTLSHTLESNLEQRLQRLEARVFSV